MLGLFFSILNQFENTSNFVSDGNLITLKNSNNNFVLDGNNIVSKIFCGFINWIGHLASDISGSSSSAFKGNRGIGIPSPIMSWLNDIAVIRSKLGISSSKFNKDINELAIKIFENGYDMRFQTSQAIPVLINELLVRTIYSIRRLILFYKNNNYEEHSIKMLWKECKPFSNNNVKRMLMVAHGSFCLLDTVDATIRFLNIDDNLFDFKEFIMRFNIVGLGRFSVSLYGEGIRFIKYNKEQNNANNYESQKIILENYIEGLKQLSKKYNDDYLLNFVEDFNNSNTYLKAFDKTINLAKKRCVSENKILKTKKDIDKKFEGNNNEKRK